MDSNIGEIIKNSLDSIRELAGVNTIIGEAINTPGGTVIIPVSKVSLGFASGGIDFMPRESKKDGGSDQRASGAPGAAANGKAQQQKPKNFGGGGGTGLTIAPIGFLVIKPDGDVSVLNITCPEGTQGGAVESIASLIEKSPDIIKKIKAVFERDKKADDEDILGDDDKEKDKEKEKKEKAEKTKKSSDSAKL